jgi:hypothetical protein
MCGYWSSVTWPVSGCTVSYRPVLSSERPPYKKNNKEIVTKEGIRIKSGHWPEGEPKTKTIWSTDLQPINSTEQRMFARDKFVLRGAAANSVVGCMNEWLRLEPSHTHTQIVSWAVWMNGCGWSLAPPPPPHTHTLIFFCSFTDPSRAQHHLKLFAST